MAIIPCGSKFFLIMAILMLIQEASAQEDDVIVSPSCSSQSCRTLSQTPSLTSSHLSLILLPGNHTINSISFKNKATFSLEGISEEITFVRCTINSVQNDHSVNIQIKEISRVNINKITFLGCNLSISDSSNINVSNAHFLNAYNHVLLVYNSSYVTIDRSHFKNNSRFIRSHDGILELSRSKNFAITRSNFTNNIVLSSYCSVITISWWSRGVITCCNFTNNSVMEEYGGIVKILSTSLAFVTNSTFLRNNFLKVQGSVIHLAFIGTSATVISSVFQFNTFGRSGAAIFIQDGGNATVLASEFSHNRARSYGYSIRTSTSSSAVIGCNQFRNNHYIYHDFSGNVRRNNSIGCSRYAFGEDGVCTSPNCEACRPPDVIVSLEFSEYRVQENIRNSGYALQICATSSNLDFTVPVTIGITSHTAEQGRDYFPLRSDCRILFIEMSRGVQTLCYYIEILDDDVIEPEEHFTVQLNSPVVTFVNRREARVTIIDNDSCDSDSQQHISSALPMTPPRVNKSVLVKCGVFHRPVTFANFGEDVSSLKNAIEGKFQGLRKRYIALLQVESVKHNGHFVDIVDPATEIEHNSIIKVTLYSQYVNICSI